MTWHCYNHSIKTVFLNGDEKWYIVFDNALFTGKALSSPYGLVSHKDISCI